jgi:hypothetical protein
MLGQETHWAQSQKIRGILTAQRLGMSAAQITPDVIDALLKTSSTDDIAAAIRKGGEG